MRVILKVRKKGIIILPKKLREIAGIKEGDNVVAEVVANTIVLKSLRPKVVNIDPNLVEKILREEIEMENRKYEEMFKTEEICS